MQARKGARVLCCDADVADDAMLAGAVARCELELGFVDIAVHAAGISGAHSITAPDGTFAETIMSRACQSRPMSLTQVHSRPFTPLQM